MFSHLGVDTFRATHHLQGSGTYVPPGIWVGTGQSLKADFTPFRSATFMDAAVAPAPHGARSCSETPLSTPLQTSAAQSGVDWLP